MPELKRYKIFLSHVWKKDENSDYYRLVNLINNASNFSWSNYSVPEHDPFQTKSNNQLMEKLREQIRQINCFLVISGMFMHYSEWIKKEINMAIEYKKPIIGIKPQGQQNIPVKISEASKEIIGWNTEAIVQAIRRYAL